jgi:hypothetical protein
MFGRTPKNQRKVLQHIPQHIHVSMRDIQYKTRTACSETCMKHRLDTQIKYLEKCVVSNSVKKLDIFTLQDIYKYVELTTQFKFSSTCKQHYALKCTITSLVVNDYMTDVSLSGLSSVTYVDCDRNVFLTDDCLVHIPNVTHFCCGFNTNFTHKIFSNLPKMTLLECDDNENMIEKNTYDVYTNNFNSGPRNVFYSTRIHDELNKLYDYVMKDIRCSYYTRRDNPSIMLRISCNPGQRFSSDGKIIVEWKHRKNTTDYKQWLKNIRTFELIKTIDTLHGQSGPLYRLCGDIHSDSPLSIWLKEHPHHECAKTYGYLKTVNDTKKHESDDHPISTRKIHSTPHVLTEEPFHDLFRSGHMSSICINTSGVPYFTAMFNSFYGAGDYSVLYPGIHMSTINATEEMEYID